MNSIKNTSVVIPFYKKYTEFDFAIKFNREQLSKAKEVVLVLDEPYDIRRFEYLSGLGINFKFLVNQDHHEWRNPCVTINHGIKNSSGEYTIVISPETIILNNALEILADATNNETFSCGSILFMSYIKFLTASDITIKQFFNGHVYYDKSHIGPMFFGSICCAKKNFINCGLYNENQYDKGWGDDDVNIRKSLKSNGIIEQEIGVAQFIHLQEDIYRDARLMRKAHIIQRKKESKVKLKYDNFVHTIPKSKNNLSITVQSPLIVDQQINKQSYNHYNIILLVQAHNEESNVVDFLNNIYDFVDGIIVLDDNSSDKTYDLFNIDEYPKIIAKFKKTRSTFDDLENRNLLLSIYNEVLQQDISNSWVLWMDLDERLGDTKPIQYYLRKKIIEDDYSLEVLSLPFFHMWNQSHYNAEYPFSQEGVQKRYKMFKNISNIKSYKINTKMKLHFELIPSIYYNRENYPTNFDHLPLSIKHFGGSDSNLRTEKYDKYTKEYDKNKIQNSYEHLLKEDAITKPFISNLPFLRKYGDNAMLNPDILDPKDGTDIRRFLLDHIKIENTLLYINLNPEEKEKLLEYQKIYPNNLAIKFAVNLVNRTNLTDLSNKEIIEKIVDSLIATDTYIA